MSPVRYGLWAGRADGQLSPSPFRCSLVTDDQWALDSAGDDRYRYADSRINHPAP